VTKLFDQVIADARSLPAEEQDRMAEALLAFMHWLRHDCDDWRMV
jgi:hypothetical protein